MRGATCCSDHPKDVATVVAKVVAMVVAMVGCHVVSRVVAKTVAKVVAGIAARPQPDNHAPVAAATQAAAAA